MDEAVAARSEWFTIEREFNVPRELMFRVWTEPEHLLQWWGPKGVDVLTADVDLRPDGLYHYSMRTADGSVMWGRFVFSKVQPPERLEFISSFSDENRGITRHPMAPNWPREIQSVVTFEEVPGGTRVVVGWKPYNATAEERDTFERGRSSMQQGWSGTFERLADYLAKV